MTTAPVDLDALEALEKAATPGPWKQHLVDDTTLISDDREVLTTCDSSLAETPNGYDNNYERMEADAAFIAALRNAAPALFAASRERDALRDRGPK